MLHRLLLTLLLACLALPATAAPRCVPRAEPAAVMPHHGHPGSREIPGNRAGAHDCIGCIAPFAGAGPILAPVGFSAAPPEPPATVPIAGQASGPATPPPRA